MASSSTVARAGGEESDEARNESSLGLSRNALLASCARIRPLVAISPLKYSLWLSEALEARVYLKLECVNEANSFKIRGATNALLTYRERHGALPSRVFTASGGNHGLAVAIACYHHAVACTVVLGQNASALRQQRLEAYGAQVVRHGRDYDEAQRYAVQVSEDAHGYYIHAFAVTDVMLGQATIALELLEQLPRAVGTSDQLLVSASIGGGGLMAGLIGGFEALLDVAHQQRPMFVAVETEGADFFAQSLARGELLELQAITSVALSLGSRTTTRPIWEYLRRRVDHALTVSDAEAVRAMRELLEHERLLVEPATSCLVAAALKHRSVYAGKTVVLIICGANSTLNEYEEWSKRFSVC